jgi:hypothetical protein
VAIYQGPQAFAVSSVCGGPTLDPFLDFLSFSSRLRGAEESWQVLKNPGVCFSRDSSNHSLLEEQLMSLASPSIAISSSRRWNGRLSSSILVLFLLFDAVAKLMRFPQSFRPPLSSVGH